MDKVFPALVRIFVVVQEPEGGRMQRMQAAGSGAIISPDGYVVTNHHVAGNASRIVVNTSDHEEIEATLVGTDPLADICVVKLKLDQRKDPSKPLPVARWADSNTVKVGDAVMAMGSPGAVAQSITKGIVANAALILPGSGNRLDGENVGEVVRWLAHDAVIYGGNSGGPLVNTDGEIVGVNEIGFASLGGAIPSNIARPVAEALIKYGDVPRSWVGIEIQPRLKSDTRATGALVASVLKDSPAGKAGLKAGDLIQKFNGHETSVGIAEDLPVFNQTVFTTEIGAEVPVVYERDGKEETTTIKTERRERPVGKPAEFKAWGVAARDITGPQALEMGRDDRKGVLIDSIRNGGPNADSKLPLQSGDIIKKVGDKEITNCADLSEVTGKLTEGKNERVPVLVTFDRDKREYVSVVKIGKDLPQDKPARTRKSWSAMATQVLTSELTEAMGLQGKKGVRVTEVFANQSADKAGFKVGDIILAADGNKIEASQPEDNDVFDTMIRKYRVGTEVVFDILRDGKPVKITMTTQTMPSQIENAKRLENTDFEFTARDLAFEDRDKKKLEEDVKGVLIESVEQAGWASLGGLRGGDVLMKVNDKEVASIDELKTMLDSIRKEKPRRITFFIRRGVHTMFREIEPDWQS